MILNGKTDIGKRRKNNQDSFVIRNWEDIDCALGVVCDGMGGANGGNIASALACEIAHTRRAFVDKPAVTLVHTSGRIFLFGVYYLTVEDNETSEDYYCYEKSIGDTFCDIIKDFIENILYDFVPVL